MIGIKHRQHPCGNLSYAKSRGLAKNLQFPCAMITPPPFTLRLSNLVSRPQNQTLCQRIVDCLHDLLENPIFLHTLEEISQHDAHEFKAQSNNGAVWRRRRHLDLGNCSYSTLWQLMWIVTAPGNNDLHDHGTVRTAMERLTVKWPSLGDLSEPSGPSIELKADVIECCLANALLTGPAMGPDWRRNALAFMARMRSWQDMWLRCLNEIGGHNGMGPYFPVRHMPWPRVLAELIILSSQAPLLQRVRPALLEESECGLSRDYRI